MLKRSVAIFTFISLFVFNSICAGIDLKNGDTFVFLGDSISHRGPYSAYVELFFITHYPERQIHFFNSGISGDKAQDALQRFDEDVAIFKPNYISVMLGMNDGGYKDFSQDIFSVYQQDMSTLIDRIQQLGAKAILISPTIFDQQQYLRRSKEPDFQFNRLQASGHYNSTMAFFGAWVREQAMLRQLSYVDFWGPLNDYTVTQRMTEATFSFCSDSIHPEAPGHAIMAAAVISDLAPERKTVSSVQASMSNGAWSVKVQNGEVSDVSGNSDQLNFKLMAHSLPWVLPEDAALGYELTKSGHKLSPERLTISGLSPGLYDISIDGENIGKPVSHLLLERKIELQSNHATPQYRQAMNVADRVMHRFNTFIVPYRNLQLKMKGQRKKLGSQKESEVQEFRLSIQPQLDELLRQSEQARLEIYKAAQPEVHSYSIAKHVY